MVSAFQATIFWAYTSTMNATLGESDPGARSHCHPSPAEMAPRSRPLLTHDDHRSSVGSSADATGTHHAAAAQVSAGS